jgi:hypothetical protein
MFSTDVIKPALVTLLFLQAFAVDRARAADAPRFSDQSLRGRWAFSASGTILPPAAPAPTPAVALGILTFEGEGRCAISDVINIGGASFSRTSSSCTYAMNADGGGTLIAQFAGDPGPTPLSFLLVSDREFRFIRVDLGVASGAAFRQDKDE